MLTPMAGNTMTSADFVQRLPEAAPRLHTLIDDHLADYDGEVLLHLLMADVRRWVISAFYNLIEEEAIVAVLALLDEALRDGDERLENAVAVSFVEDSCVWHPRMAPFLSAWPLGLQKEAARQQSTR